MCSKMISTFRGKPILTGLGCLCVILFVIMNLWQDQTANTANDQTVERLDTGIIVRSHQDPVSSKFGDSSKVIDSIKVMETSKVVNFNKVEVLPHAFTYKNNTWQFANLCKPYKIYQNRSDFPLVRFSSQAGTGKIFVHSTSVDGISSIIQRSGAFEVGTINRIIYELQKDNSLNLIDIGTNVGQHSIAAALIGRDSIAIDGAKSNIEHLCATVQYLNFSKKVTMVYNIFSDSNEKRHVRYSANNDHFGNTYVESDGIANKMLSAYKKGFFSEKTVTQSAATLDDLLRLPQIQHFKRVFIKLDVEGHEHKVLQGGKEFFRTTYIAGMIMEWAWHINRKTGDSIISFMMERKFKPYEVSRTRPGTQIDISDRNPNKWPQDIIWLPIK